MGESSEKPHHLSGHSLSESALALPHLLKFCALAIALNISGKGDSRDQSPNAAVCLLGSSRKRKPLMEQRE